MSLDPMPVNLMAFDCCIQRLPELGILDRFLVGGFPIMLFPVVKVILLVVSDVSLIPKCHEP